MADNHKNVLPEATIVTTIDDEVLELCTRTVASTPIIRPAIGFCSSSLCENAAPNAHSAIQSFIIIIRNSIHVELVMQSYKYKTETMM